MPRTTLHLRLGRLGALPAIVALLVSAAAAPLRAQEPADRALLERFRDSLAATSDSSGLLLLERRLIDSAKAHRGDPLLHLKLGFLSLRLGDLGGQSHYDDAASEFQWGIDLKPQWPYPWLGMGYAEYGVGDSQVSIVAGLQTMFGKDALSRSANAFAKSAEVDSGFGRGLTELANTALRQRVNIKLGVALQALRRAGSTVAGGSEDVLLARGRVEREVGDLDSAAMAFARALPKATTRSLVLLEIARTDLLRGRIEGANPYFDGATADDSITIAGYRADLSPIATDSILREFDATRGKYRLAYLERFWRERGEGELRTPAERLCEHYRRLYYARRNFALVSRSRHYDIAERYRSGSRDFDDRGIIYIRHGDPTARASYQGSGVEPNESWRYERTDGDYLFHFVAREDVQDYKLVESVFDILSFSTGVQFSTGTPIREGPALQQLLISREGLSPIYQRFQGAGPGGLSVLQTEERALGRNSIRLGTRSDSYELHFTRDLHVRTQVLSVGRDTAGSHVQITYAIAGRGLEPVAVGNGIVYQVRLRFTAVDASGRVAASLDTTRRFIASSRVPDTEHLVGRIDVPMPDGDFAYRLAVQQGEDAGILLPRDSVRVGRAGLGETGPALSDLVLGSRAANLVWRPTPVDTVFFNPLRTFRRNDRLRLYYEVTGLDPQAAYTTQLFVRKRSGTGGMIKKVFGGSGPQVKLSFDEAVTARVMRVERELKLDRLKPGIYALEVVVRDRAGHEDRRAQEFQIGQE